MMRLPSWKNINSRIGEVFPNRRDRRLLKVSTAIAISCCFLVILFTRLDYRESDALATAFLQLQFVALFTVKWLIIFRAEN